MRDVLSERLLASVMGWGPEDVARERPVLQVLADLKYDEYQQYSPGMRFVESLALWLSQFELRDERQLAYDWVRSNLAFLSGPEVGHLVSMAFPDIIRPIIMDRTARNLKAPANRVTKIVNSVEYRVLTRQSLFLGLSDGARIDLFRRLNAPEISHEQVWQTYEVSEAKAEDMLKRLVGDLRASMGRELSDEESRFHLLFLLDDFSASGISYLRRDSTGVGFEGKISKILKTISSDLKDLFIAEGLEIWIILYVATEKSLAHIDRYLKEWLHETGHNYACHVRPVYAINDHFCFDGKKELRVMELLQKYFDPEIIDSHYQKGKHEYPYLGFDECALPLVLTHNCPNNSLPLLWFEEGRKYRGLFPRVSRHKQ